MTKPPPIAMKNVTGHIARTNLFFFASFLAQGVRAFVLIPLFLRLLHPEGYGHWVLVMSWAGYAVILAQLALDTSVYQFVTPHLGTPRSNATYWTIIRVLVVWLAALFVVSLIGAWAFTPVGVPPYVAAAGGFIVGQVLWTLFLTPFRCEERTEIFFGVGILITLGDFAVTVVTAFLTRQILDIICALAVYHLSCAAILFAVQRRRFPIAPLQKEEIRPCAAFGANMTFLQLVSSANFVLDRSIVGLFSGLAAVASYAPGVALGSLLLPLNAAGTVTLPTLLVRKDVRNDRHMKKVIFQNALKQWALIAIPAAVGIIIVSHSVLHIITTPELAAAGAPIAWIAAMACLVEGFGRFTTTALRVELETDWLAYVRALHLLGFVVLAGGLAAALRVHVGLIVAASIFLSNLSFTILGFVRLRRHMDAAITMGAFKTPVAGTAAFALLSVMFRALTTAFQLGAFVALAVVIYGVLVMVIEKVPPAKLLRVIFVSK